MLIKVEKDLTKGTLGYILNNVILIFEGFLTLFQNSGATIHMVNKSQFFRLSDSELIIGQGTRTTEVGEKKSSLLNN